jgi:tetratricopeptide (TPR) repeat protein
LKKSEISIIKTVFQQALKTCFKDLGNNSKGFKWITGIIYLISKYGGYMIGLECLSEIDQSFNSNQVSNTIRQSDSPALQLLVLNIHFLIENQTENSIEHVTEAMERCKDIDLGSTSSKTCLSMLWKAGESCCLQGDYHKAINWYQLAAKLLSINLADARNKAIIMNKIANCQIHLGLYADALESCLKSMMVFNTPRCWFGSKREPNNRLSHV